MGLIDYVHFVMGGFASAVVEETLGVKAAVDLLLKNVGSGRWMQIEAKSGRQLLYHIITGAPCQGGFKPRKWELLRA